MTLAWFVVPACGPLLLSVLPVVLLLSGLDDLIPLGLCLRAAVAGFMSRQKRVAEVPAEEVKRPERRIAIFVPCWHESAVIGNMVRHNLAAIRYRNFDFFLGVYPNDGETVGAAEELAKQFGNVHVAKCPNPGPTSKADCLNGVYARMELLEDEQGVQFDTVILHDAEDMIHPQALALINRERDHYDMVQVPVLPLETGLGDVTHGVYCDEFAEFQTIDMRARQFSGAFIPSNGVGTGFSREVLGRLARERDYQVFDPESLTEDYQIGVHIHAMGYRQCFCPLERMAHDFVATREYFPRSTRTAIRQRTRWITGIALQCWAQQGWRGSWRTKYWFWRDRKGLITNPLSVAANAWFIVGVLDYLASLAFHTRWHFRIENHTVAALCAMTMGLQCLRLGIRGLCVARIFGFGIAATVPLRSFHANLINCSAALRAVYGYVAARREKRALAWQKTDHAYPSREALNGHRRELVDILVGSGFVSEEQIQEAKKSLAEGSALDLMLLAHGILSEENLCKALSLQSGLPAALVDPAAVKAQVVRGLPAHLEKRHGLLPFEVRSGKLLVASASIPSPAAFDEVGKMAELPVEVHLVTKSTYDKLRELL